MILLVHTEPEFTRLVHETVPAIAKVPRVREAMKKYTSGWLTGHRLDDALKGGTLPMIGIDKLDYGASGRQSGDRLDIDSGNFAYYKKSHPTYLRLIPVTVLHELAHWGYWTGQQQGHPSDAAGREHHGHGDYKSPLDTELEMVLDAIKLLTAPKTR